MLECSNAELDVIVGLWRKVLVDEFEKLPTAPTSNISKRTKLRHVKDFREGRHEFAGVRRLNWRANNTTNAEMHINLHIYMSVAAKWRMIATHIYWFIMV